MLIGSRECTLGFDWSVWQTPRNLEPAARAGHEFFVVKATEGNDYRDPYYRQHVANAVDAGLVCGAYHYARPNERPGVDAYDDGRNEAYHFLHAVDSQVAFVALDLEATTLDEGRTTDYVHGWFDVIDESGFWPVREQRLLYVGVWFTWRHCVATAGRTVLWQPWYTAGYTPNPDPTRIPLPGWSKDLWPEGWALWQYTSSATVAGIHPSDANVATTQWLHAVIGDVHDPDPFPDVEDNAMARCTYHFPEGSADDHALIDLRNGAYVDGGGVHYGPHWYCTDDSVEIAALVLNREVNPAWVQLFAAGNDALDALWERWPRVFAS